MTTIEIPKGYENVLLTVFVLSLERLLIGFFVAGRARVKSSRKSLWKKTLGNNIRRPSIKRSGEEATQTAAQATMPAD